MNALSFVKAVSDQGIDASIAPADSGLLARRVPIRWLVGLLVGWLALDMLLLWQFLGLTQPLATLGGAALAVLLVREAAKAVEDRAGPTVGAVLACIGCTALILAMGGEGRFFYANPDWRLRDALLRDLSIHPWPFAYATPDGIALLRAPLAMYLLPALGGKLWGQAGADLVLLAQNAVLDGVLLALGSILFATRRARLIALGCFLCFSGLDIVGQLLRGHAHLLTPTAHLEPWGATQYSSTITLFFWVPQHAFAGWCGAVSVLLWRTGQLRASVPLMLFPLLLLWSPLAGMGLLPFMIWIAIDELLRRRVKLRDGALVGGALLLSMPALFYLKAGGGSVGSRIFPLLPIHYLLFEAIEVLPFLLVAAAGAKGRFGGMLFAIMTLSLLLIPYGQIGWANDFAMRASIPSLAILSVQLADLLAGSAVSALRRRLLLTCLAIGSLTGLAEIARGLSFPIAPAPHCPLTSQWLVYSDFRIASATYTAPLAKIPSAIRPADAEIVALAPACRDAPGARPALFD